jgi:hypothetical protein
MKNISVMYCIRKSLHMDSISIFVEFTYTGAVGLVTCIVLSTHPPSCGWNVRNLRARYHLFLEFWHAALPSSKRHQNKNKGRNYTSSHPMAHSKLNTENNRFRLMGLVKNAWWKMYFQRVWLLKNIRLPDIKNMR